MRLAGLVFISLSFMGCALDGAADDESVSTSTTDQPLIGAPIDHHDKWDVGVCSGPLNTDPTKGAIGACLTPGTRCSGTLIAPDVVLTARHCIYNIDFTNAVQFCDAHLSDTRIAAGPVRITTDISVLGAVTNWTDVDEVLVPENNAMCNDDIAVLRLHKSVPWWITRPVGLDLRDIVKHQPREIAMVGRGVIEQTFDVTNYSEISEDNGGLMRRKLEHIPFTCVSDTPGTCGSPDILLDYISDYGDMEFGASAGSGDSGAGVMRQRSYASGRPKLIGVLSSGTMDPVTGKPNFAYANRLDIHKSFIRNSLHRCGHSDLAQSDLGDDL